MTKKTDSNYYLQFAEWTQQGVNFVYRLKDNAKVQVQEVLFERTLSKEEFGVYKVEHIHLDYKQDRQVKTVCLRLVYLLLQVIQVVNESKKAFSTIAALIRIHLISHLDLA